MRSSLSRATSFSASSSNMQPQARQERLIEALTLDESDRYDGEVRSGFITAGGLRLETRWVGPPPEEAPTLVFLHEGLGSVSLWKDFPDRLPRQTGCGALIYSRAGYGKSDPAPLPRPVRFMHDEAEVLSEVLEQ